MEVDDAVLADLGAVSLSDVLALRFPEKQRPFDLFCTVSDVPGALSASQPQSQGGVDAIVSDLVAASDASVQVVDGAFCLDVFCQKFYTPSAAISPGHVVYFCDMRFRDSEWRATQYLNVSVLPGVLNSTFLRCTVGVGSLDAVTGIQRPDTVHVHVRVVSVCVDVVQRLLVLSVLDVDSGDHSLVVGDEVDAGAAAIDRPPTLLSVSSGAVLLHLVGMKKREFWKGAADAGHRSVQAGRLAGKSFYFAVALSAADNGTLCNRISAICATRK